MQVELSDDRLSEVVPLILDGLVVAAEIVTVRDDPFLPSGWEDDPGIKRMVEAGLQLAKWQVRVDSVIKGNAPAEIWAVRGIGAVGFWIEGMDEGRRLFNTVNPGRVYRMWLEEDAWFGQNHWILVRARPV